LKFEFINNEHFIIYCFSDDKIRTEDEMKTFFKLLNYDLKHRYNYEFHGFYNVTIYCCDELYILDFESVDDYGSADFNITMLLNSVILYEFEDFDIINGDKIFYKNKFYIEVIDMLNDIHLFEYGNIIYGNKVEEILNNGILVSI